MGSASDSFKGLAGIFNEDDSNDCKVFPSSTEPALKELHRRGVWLGALGQPQSQVQDMQTGFDAATFYVGCEPFCPAPGTTIPARSDVRTPSNTAHAYLATAFTLPAVNSTVQITIKAACGEDTSDFTAAVGNYTSRVDDIGIFVGGVFFDLVSIDSSTTMTIRNRGLAGAVITAIG